MFGVLVALLLLLVLTAIVVESCSGTSFADRRRAEVLARDLIFERLDERWERSGDMTVNPAFRLAAGVNLTEIRQIYDAGDVDDPLNELRRTVTVMEDEGWIDLVANCEYMTISGQRADDYGYVSLSVGLYEPGTHVWSELLSAWVGRAEIFADFVDEARTELMPRGEDLSCLLEP